MSKLIVATVLLGSLTGAAMVFSAGCVSQGIDDSGSATLYATNDADATPLPTKGQITISEVYGSGGLTGASKSHDYIELFNKTNKPITLDGLSLQTAATPTSSFNVVVELKGTLPPNGYFLVKGETGNEGGPAPVLTGENQDAPGLKLGAKDGKVALVASIAPLNCNGTTCASAKYLDLVGWGGTSNTEGTSAIPALDDAKKAAIRKEKGCTDGDNNGADFTVGDPDPQNAASDAYPCPVPVKDASPETGADAKPPAPPVKDPDLGPESYFDAGYRPEAGPKATSGGASDDCAVGAVGGPGGFSLFAPLGGLALAALAVARRRLKAQEKA